MCLPRRLAALALGLFPACASPGEPPPLVPVDVKLIDIAVGGVERAETTLLLTVRYGNENPLPLGTLGGVIGLSLDEVRAGKALFKRSLEIPGPGEAEETVELRVDNALLTGELAGLRSTASIDYLVEAKLYLHPRHFERVMTSSRAGRLEPSAGLAADLAALDDLSTDPEPRTPAPPPSDP
jgi:LEA14-like dessication related protein